MIETHPTFTDKLSEDEKRIIPLVVSILQAHKGRAGAIQCFALCDVLNKYIDDHRDQFKSKRFKMQRARANKIIAAIRMSNLLPCVCGYENGYFIATNPEELRVNIKSLKDRAEAIQAAADALQRDLEIMENPLHLENPAQLAINF